MADLSAFLVRCSDDLKRIAYRLVDFQKFQIPPSQELFILAACEKNQVVLTQLISTSVLCFWTGTPFHALLDVVSASHAR